MVRWVALVSAMVLLACDAAPRVVGRAREPAVYVMLSPTPTGASADSILYALVLMSDGPFASTYLAPRRFEMRREADDSLVAWTAIAREGEVPLFGANGALPSDGNLVLRAAAIPGAIGRAGIRAGDTYRLEVELDDRLVIGRARVPRLPTPVLVQTSDSVTVHWRRDPAVGVYWVFSDTEGPFFSRFTADTVLRLPLVVPPNERPALAYVRVIALDSARARFALSDTVTSAGLGGTLGLFGAASRDSVLVPSTVSAGVIRR